MGAAVTHPSTWRLGELDSTGAAQKGRATYRAHDTPARRSHSRTSSAGCRVVYLRIRPAR